jgi:DNA-binding transcriptional ArsR family regulator
MSTVREAITEPIDRRLVKAMAHPLRHRILSRLNERVASPKELADEFCEPLGNVSYHMRILADLGCVELVRTEQRRGALEHYYRAMMRPFFNDSEWARIPLSTRRAIHDQHLRRIWNDVASAAANGGFDDTRAHVTWTPLDLDEQGYEDVVEVLGEALERLLEIQADCAARQVESGDGAPAPIATEVVMLHFGRDGHAGP